MYIFSQRKAHELDSCLESIGYQARRNDHRCWCVRKTIRRALDRSFKSQVRSVPLKMKINTAIK